MQITISDEDAAIVGAVLMTHSAQQDHRVVGSMVVLGRLLQDPAASDLQESLKEDIEILEQDSDNLKRLARAFGVH